MIERDNWKDYWNEHHKVPSCEIDEGLGNDLPDELIPTRRYTRFRTLIIFLVIIGILIGISAGVGWLSILLKASPSIEMKEQEDGEQQRTVGFRFPRGGLLLNVSWKISFKGECDGV